MVRRLHPALVMILALLGAALACSVEVSTAHLENLRTYKAPSREDSATRTFARGETVYALVDLKDAAHPLTIEAVWVQVIEAPAGGKASVLELARETVEAQDGLLIFAQEPPAEGWPPGAYRLILYLDGLRELTTDFRVR